MTAEATATCHLVPEEAEKKEGRKERRKAKKLNENVGKLMFV
jgi:hypothetical protein